MNMFCTPVEDQRRFDVAVVMVTVIRPSLEKAVESIFAQDFPGRVQILIGVDRPLGAWSLIDQLQRRAPENRVVSVLYPGYSTSARHGGLYPALDGGCLRTVLSLLANAFYLAYLDDDNWWAHQHLSSLVNAIQGHQFAYSQRWLVDEVTQRPVCVDKWHSTGCAPNAFPDMPNGFSDPNTLMIDKRPCSFILPYWSLGQGVTADRAFFTALSEHFRGNGTNQPTSYYVIRRTNVLWRHITADPAPGPEEACTPPPGGGATVRSPDPGGTTPQVTSGPLPAPSELAARQADSPRPARLTDGRGVMSGPAGGR